MKGPSPSFPLKPLLALVTLLVLWGSWGYLSSNDFEHHSPYPADGPFQLFNALRRIGRGDAPLYFHGQGLPYLHYPLFVLLGRSIHASEMARYFLNEFLLVLSVWLWGWIFFKDRRILVKFVLLALFLFFVLNMDDFLGPGNSQLTTRTFFPLLGLAVAWGPGGSRWKYLGLMLAGGSALACGSEQGLAFLGAWGITGAVPILLSLRDKKWKEAFQGILKVGIVTAGSIFVLGLWWGAIDGWKNIPEAARYYFSLLPQDQFWYFGVPPNHFIRSWRDLSLDTHIVLAVLLGLLAWVGSLVLWKGRRGLWDPRALFTFSLSYGLIGCLSCLGYYDWHYVENLGRLEILLALPFLIDRLAQKEGAPGVLRKDFSGLSAIQDLIEKIESGALSLLDLFDFKDRARFRRGFYISVLAFLAFWEGMYLWQGDQLQALAGGIAEWRAGRLPDPGEDWGPYLDLSLKTLAARQPAGRKIVLWSTYAGWLQDRLGTFNPVREDYIIHALGPARRKGYLEDLRRVQPDWIETLRRSKMHYEDWVQCTSWGFYRETLDHYIIAAVTPHSLLWHREKPRGSEGKETDFSLPSGARSFTAPPGPWGQLVTVRIHYRLHNPWNRIPFLRYLPRYLIHPAGALIGQDVSLPPYEEVWEFPIIPVPGQPWRLDWETASLLPGPSLEIERIDLIPRTLGPDQQAFLEPPPPQD